MSSYRYDESYQRPPANRLRSRSPLRPQNETERNLDARTSTSVIEPVPAAPGSTNLPNTLPSNHLPSSNIRRYYQYDTSIRSGQSFTGNIFAEYSIPEPRFLEPPANRLRSRSPLRPQNETERNLDARTSTSVIEPVPAAPGSTNLPNTLPSNHLPNSNIRNYYQYDTSIRSGRFFAGNIFAEYSIPEPQFLEPPANRLRSRSPLRPQNETERNLGGGIETSNWGSKRCAS